MKGEVSVVRLHEIAIATFVTLTLAVAAWADPQAQNSDSKHLGVKSCSGDNCHGAVKPAEHSAVMQNEYLIWSQETDKDRVDKHHRAYAVLGDERGIRIARNLGLPDAVTAEICLNCHADNVPETRRGPRFEMPQHTPPLLDLVVHIKRLVPGSEGGSRPFPDFGVHWSLAKPSALTG